jgi:hypothetical protein
MNSQQKKYAFQRRNNIVPIIDPLKKYEGVVMSEHEAFIFEEAKKQYVSSKNGANPAYSLDFELLKNSLEEFYLIDKAGLQETVPQHVSETCCVIAFKDRHAMLEMNVDLLSKQSLIPAVVLVASNYNDAQFSLKLAEKYENVFATFHQNYPIGGKWDAGVQYAKKLDVNGVLILGSDDVLSLDYIQECYSAINSGIDMIGNRKWMIYDTSKNLYLLEYTKNVGVFLGGGKMFSKKFLDSVDWTIFDKRKPKHLDDYSYYLLEEKKGAKKTIDDSHFILSIKGKWEMLNSAEHLLQKGNLLGRITHENINHKKEHIFNKLKNPNIDGILE